MTIVAEPMTDYESSDHSNQSEDENLRDGNNSDDEGIEDENSKEETDKKLVYMCKYCDLAFALREACFAHEIKDHDIQCPYACHLCDYKCKVRKLLLNHIRETHSLDRPYICVQCHKGFHVRSYLQKHTFVHTGVRPYTCETCGKTFKRSNNFTKHLQIHTVSKPHPCKFCPKSFGKKSGLVRHQAIHFDEGKQFSCSKCDTAYTTEHKLLIHECIPVATKKEVQQPVNKHFACDRCPKEFTTNAELQKHSVSHLVIPVHTIHRTLKLHVASVPEKIASAPLQVCQKTLTRKDKILGHERIHDDKLFPCTNCEAKFTRKETLALHSEHYCTTTMDSSEDSSVGNEQQQLDDEHIQLQDSAEEEVLF